jgi:hypothetical protein
MISEIIKERHFKSSSQVNLIITSKKIMEKLKSSPSHQFSLKNTLFINYLSSDHSKDDIKSLFPDFKVDPVLRKSDSGILTASITFPSH